MNFDRYGQLKPSGPREWLHDRDSAFLRICPFSPVAGNEDELAERHFPAARNRDYLLGRFEAAFVGHVEEEEFRANGSSGGLVSWVAAELLRRRLVDGVAHVAPVDPKTDGDRRLFRYTLSRSLDAIKAGAKSRYYPVEMSEVLETIRAIPGRYAIVGIPCFIKAVRLSCAADPILAERIAFTLGLFCGHMKSARMAESFAWQMGRDVSDVERLDYRVKCPDRPANWYRAQLTLRSGESRSRDWWDLADGDWGAGFFQNSACNFCDDVVAETADIAFGDAWKEPYSADGRGTNVVIVRSFVLLGLIRAGMKSGRLNLSDVDAAFVIATQAAGFRQRREGLAFRLSWLRRGLLPRKRIVAAMNGLSARRRMIYAVRYGISFWSHRVFWLARLLRWPRLYLAWARTVLTCYHGFAYSRGPLGRMLDWFGSSGAEGGD
ncbi:Coenzyme F420 hydrogenase/dehydrogenase, beta subunit C-terminal domain [Rhizobium sp. NXC24]|uniref:Coenzyme F420 hydrogenase/dehydrogenase, beta subunit C-terminal domain n=1 Tax=Rhizobium sp. NXC24 TaxID=2048897 RepID=UPI000CF217AC|nr:Coenzyme F420 hydrogenase/dehydrogenase, beta subunit C-terminal domain [Rhizobium sp. NXC24]